MECIFFAGAVALATCTKYYGYYTPGYYGQCCACLCLARRRTHWWYLAELVISCEKIRGPHEQ